MLDWPAYGLTGTHPEKKYSLSDYSSFLNSFVESLEASKPFYVVRFIGGLFVVSGMIIMAYNCYKTSAASKAKKEASDVELALEVAKWKIPMS